MFRHALQYLDLQQNVPFAFACCIYPTAVLVIEEPCIRAFDRLSASPRHNYCFSVCEFRHPIERALRIGNDGTVAPVHQDHSLTRSQDLKPHYFDAGLLLGNRQARYRGHPIFTGGSLPYILNSNEFVDINTPADWQLAEAMARSLGVVEQNSDAARSLVCRGATADK